MRPEHGAIGLFLMVEEEGPEGIGDGEGDHEIFGGQDFAQLFMKPLCGRAGHPIVPLSTPKTISLKSTSCDLWRFLGRTSPRPSSQGS
jgi:hypothetical protein